MQIQVIFGLKLDVVRVSHWLDLYKWFSVWRISFHLVIDTVHYTYFRTKVGVLLDNPIQLDQVSLHHRRLLLILLFLLQVQPMGTPLLPLPLQIILFGHSCLYPVRNNDIIMTVQSKNQLSNVYDKWFQIIILCIPNQFFKHRVKVWSFMPGAVMIDLMFT